MNYFVIFQSAVDRHEELIRNAERARMQQQVSSHIQQGKGPRQSFGNMIVAFGERIRGEAQSNLQAADDCHGALRMAR